MDTLPDYLRDGLKIISVGLNPSIPSVKAGFYFANPRNRFWKALNSSRLVSVPLEPGEESMQILFNKFQIGFTDLVKRPSRMGKDLKVADYRAWAPVLQEKLLRYQPSVIWFHGVGTYKSYLKYAEDKEREVPLGPQKHVIGKSSIFVTPNPSPANAKYSLEELVRYYNELVSYQIRVSIGLG